ncbi:MAG: hypothetical protein SGJ23_08840 [Alphaproteobacteria bacterium]|nr:hypothetical protein [Alphaproteobacteria bacterium]
MVFGQAFFDVESVENFTIGDDPKMVHFAVLPMQFAVRECGGVTVHADATLDTSLHEEAFQDLHKVRDGVFRKQDVGSYLVVAPGHSGGMFEGGFHFTEVRIESGDLPCATAWLEDRLHRVRVRSESEIRNRLP